MAAKFESLTQDMEAMIEQGYLSKAEIKHLMTETDGMQFVLIISFC
jgi:hypothetical protein